MDSKSSQIIKLFLAIIIVFVISVLGIYIRSLTSIQIKEATPEVFQQSPEVTPQVICSTDFVLNTPTPMPSNTPIPTDTPLPTATSISTPTATATLVPTNTSIPTLTATPVPTSTSNPIPTATISPIPTATATLAQTNTSTPAPTSTSIPTSTPILISTLTPLPVRGFLSCGQVGCVHDSDCAGTGLSCVTANTSGNRYCAVTEYKVACENGPTTSRCCSPMKPELPSAGVGSFTVILTVVGIVLLMLGFIF